MKLGNEDVKLYLGDSEVEKIYLGTEQVYSGGSEPTPPHDYSQDYFTTESLEEGDNEISFTMGDGMTTAITTAVTSVSVSTDDGVTWTSMENIGAGASLSVSLRPGEKAIWKGEAVRYAVNTSQDRHTRFSSMGQFKVYGNIMSLISGDTFEDAETFTGINTFCALFKECTGLTSAENLILPATTLTQSCYRSMFNGCTSLTTAPELPATTLSDNCYNQMFKGCTSLSSITCLATDISAGYCTKNWVSGVAASGTFVKAASMNDWTTGNDGIPTGWTVQDDAE